MKLEILAVDRLRAGWSRDAVAEYVRRVGRYCPIERKNVKRAGDDAAAAEEEGARLLRLAAPGAADRVVVLDRTGEAIDSSAWASLLDQYANEAVGRVVFVVGGAGGLSPEVRQAAHRTLGLGPQTLSHELAQVVLAEQLYRAWTILRGEPYHK